MAKNNNYKHTSTEKKQKRLKPAIIIAIIASAVIICFLLAAGIALMHKSTANTDTDSASSGSSDSTATIYCAINYPCVQSNNEIWQTGGMQETSCTTLREALENDFSSVFSVAFDDSGALIELGQLRAEDGARFEIYSSTTQGMTLLSEAPADIILEDTLTYEIMFVDEDGNRISSIE